MIRTIQLMEAIKLIKVSLTLSIMRMTIITILT